MSKYYSVRMRASKYGAHEQGGKHISGGEMISTYEGMKQAVNALLEKGLSHSRGKADFMQIQFDVINEPIKFIKPLQVITKEAESAEHGQVIAKNLLKKAGIPQSIIEKAYDLITEYSGIRGAIVIDIHSGKRLDDRNEKGVRVSRMDWPEMNFAKWAACCQVPQSARVKEALALASKVSLHPAALAELCWSDDPDYITGYVAGKKLGYQRITKLKEYGNEQGCRVFFVDGLKNVTEYIQYLEQQPVFIQWEEENGPDVN